ncbi:MAG: hypothetical protein D6702_02750 [Planctomycetota bacterium]|nr:MAG: hypothetical protein D6702_02750 [Planctomycetota bacterium]
MSGEWRYQRRQGACAVCGRSFAADETVFSLLRFAGEELERGDLCSPCFDGREETEDVFFWRTRHAEDRRGLRVDFDLVLGVLQRLREDERPERRDFCFLIALLLVRHRKLRLQGVVRRRGREFLQLRRPRARQPFEVEVRELDEERRSRLSAVLAGLLDPAREADLEDLLTPARTSRG